MKSKSVKPVKRLAVSEETNKNKKLKLDDNNSKLSKSELYKAPTVEELNQLRETEILFNSNLFRLQIEELLREIKLKKKRRRGINGWIEKFSKFITSLPDCEECTVADFDLCLEDSTKSKLSRVLKQINKNKPLELKTDQNCPVKFVKPKNVNLSGLYPFHACVGPTITITLNLVVPKKFFQAKDYLNARYIVKRSLYLSYIATHLKLSNLTSKVSYSFLRGNTLAPILFVETNECKNVVFEVLLTPEVETFKISRFNYDKINLRDFYTKSITGISLPDNTPTVFYNSMLLHDVTLCANDSFRLEVQNLRGACEALALLGVWLRQRELTEGIDLLLGLIANFVHNSRINKHMSSYQVLRNVWVHLAQSTWDVPDSTTENLHVYHDVVFKDSTGCYNLAADLDVAVYRRIKAEAAQALNYLDEGSLNSFQMLFMTPIPFYLQYDAIINIYNGPKLNNVYQLIEDKQKADYLNYKRSIIIKHLRQTFETGLTDRILCIVPRLKNSISWNIDESAPVETKNDVFVSFGVKLDVSNMFKVVDKGPEAYDPLATEFRDFWGEKAELRRFKDGTISEAVYWAATTIRDKRKISKNIIKYILQDKFKLSNFTITFDQFEQILNKYNNPAVEEANLRAVTLFDEVAKKLRELELPLSIASVQGVSEVFSHADPWPPTPASFKTETKVTEEVRNSAVFKQDLNLKIVPRFVAPVEGVLQMVQNSKWPNDLEAMNQLRIAFYLQMSEQLHRSGVEMVAGVSKNHLDVTNGGLVIRLELFHNKELALLSESGATKEAEFREIRCVVLPRLRGLLGGVHARNPSAGPTAALAKRWLSAQLLDDGHISSIVVGLLAAAAYLPNTGNPPALPQLGFLQFLSLLSRFPWDSQPLILDWHQELTTEQRNEIDVRFRENRQDLPPMCLVTAADPTSRITTQAPSVHLMHRLKLLATQALQLLEQRFFSSEIFPLVVGLFKPNLTGYNVLIHLHPFLNARRDQNLFGKYKSTTESKDFKNNKIPIVDFNPAELLLRDLRKYYSDFALFFHDSYGGEIIAVLWKPHVLQKEEFKISVVNGMKLIPDEDGKLEVNFDALVDDFYKLGDGIVKNIEIL